MNSAGSLPTNTTVGSSECESLTFSDWEAEVDNIIQKVWGDKKKTDLLKSIWTMNDGDKQCIKEEEQAPLSPPGFPCHSSTPTFMDHLHHLEPTTPHPLDENNNYLPPPPYPGYSPEVNAGSTPGSISHNMQYTMNPFNPVWPMPQLQLEMAVLINCFASIESLDRDIKACELLMGISSLGHPLGLPMKYDVNEVEKLLAYSMKQLEFFTGFTHLVYERFKWEERRLEDANENIFMWNQAREHEWDESSFEYVLFSTSSKIIDRWENGNGTIKMLLTENGPHHFTNLQFLPIYIVDLEKAVCEAKMFVWFTTEKIKMTQGMPGPVFDSFSSFHFIRPVPEVISPTVDSESKTKSDAMRHRRRRGKNFTKF